MRRRDLILAGAAVLLAAAATTAIPSSVGAQQRASPLDSVTAAVHGADLAIQYGRPSMRERTIYGGLVPWDRVWRTGANEATHFRTSADLQVGEATIPAGEYTLYTIPGKERWTLVVNKQTGQWGTQYDESQDLIRLPMKVSSLESPVEMFTISIETTEDGGVLALDWAKTRAYLAFAVKGDDMD